ncbi:unnamed protein product, partial [Prorocentrum cordatum]
VPVTADPNFWDWASSWPRPRSSQDQAQPPGGGPPDPPGLSLRDAARLLASSPDQSFPLPPPPPAPRPASLAASAAQPNSLAPMPPLPSVPPATSPRSPSAAPAAVSARGGSSASDSGNETPREALDG